MCSLQNKNRHTKNNESDRKEIVKQEKQKKYGNYRSRMLMHLQNTGALTTQFYSDLAFCVTFATKVKCSTETMAFQNR